ncbi:MAG: response regulator [Verrucomicrobia bacterium]|nr:MAG: response regulator [Verrucomicrobiota bacterium]
MSRILVIDDEPDMGQLVKDMLQPTGHEIILAADGAEGVRQSRSFHPDLAITDIYMPNEDGLETILELRRLFPRMAIIAMSGRDNAEVMLSVAKKLGALAILQKPFERERLIELVCQALGNGSVLPQETSDE